jgi:hypothetical protein
MTTVSKKGRAVYVKVGIWPYKDGSIHLSSTEVHGFNIAVNADPAKPNGHRTLFKMLAKILDENGVAHGLN